MANIQTRPHPQSRRVIAAIFDARGGPQQKRRDPGDKYDRDPTPKGEFIVAYCAPQTASVGDLVKMYGPWTEFVDGNNSEYRRSLFTFKSGELEIDASGCYRTVTNDIRVHMLLVKWPTPKSSE